MKELKAKLIVSKVLYFIFFVLLPVMIINQTYRVFYFHTKTSVRTTGATIIVIILLFYLLKRYIKSFFKMLAPGSFKVALLAICHSLPYLAILIVLRLSMKELDRFANCATWVLICLIVATVIGAYDDVLTQEYGEIKLAKRMDKYRSEGKL